MSQPSFEQWLSERQHELRTKYGNEHLSAMKAEEYQAWLREQYELEHPGVDPNALRTENT